MQGLRRARFGACGLAGVALALVVSACGSSGGSDNGGVSTASGSGATAGAPGSGGNSGATSADLGHFTLIVSSSAGGGADTIARQIAPYWEKGLGTDIKVVDQPAGHGAIGGATTANDDSCQTAIIFVSPSVQIETLDPQVKFGLQGETTSKPTVYPLGSIASDYGVVVVPKDSPYKTLKDLVTAARAKPGKLLAPVSSLGGDTYMRMLQFEAAFNIKLNIVPFNGGSASRKALLSGQAAMEYTGLVSQIGIKDQTRVLAVAASKNDYPDLTDNAPTLQDATSEAFPDVTLPDQGNWPKTYAMYTSSSCKQKHPATYTKIVDALKAGWDSADYQKDLDKTGASSQHSYIAPDDYFSQAASALAAVKQLGIHN